jgi:hypothetical protein
VRHRQYKQRHYKKKQKHSPRNDCGYRRPRFCRHEFLRESTAEAFALVRPIKFDRRTKGRVTLIGTDSAEMHVLRQLEKSIFRPATRCHHKKMRIDSHAASASDAPMPTFTCPKSARLRKRLALRTWRTTQKPSRIGICKSRSTASGGSRWMRSRASRPFVASTTRCPTASKSSAIVRPRPDGGIRASYFGAGGPCMAPSAFTQYSADPGHIFDEPSERGSHEEFLERPAPSFIVNTGQLAPHTISWALSQGMWDKVSACLTE